MKLPTIKTTEVDAMKAGKKLSDYRTRHEVSQVELADALGINKSFLCRLESGNRGKDYWTQAKYDLAFSKVDEISSKQKSKQNEPNHRN